MEEAKVTSSATALIPNADAFEGQMPDLMKPDRLLWRSVRVLAAYFEEPIDGRRLVVRQALRTELFTGNPSQDLLHRRPIYPQVGKKSTSNVR